MIVTKYKYVILYIVYIDFIRRRVIPWRKSAIDFEVRTVQRFVNGGVYLSILFVI